MCQYLLETARVLLIEKGTAAAQPYVAALILIFLTHIKIQITEHFLIVLLYLTQVYTDEKS